MNEGLPPGAENPLLPPPHLAQAKASGDTVNPPQKNVYPPKFYTPRNLSPLRPSECFAKIPPFSHVQADKTY